MAQAARNPQAALQQLMQSDPRISKVIDYINQQGGNAEAAFYAKARELGKDPNAAIRQTQQALSGMKYK